MKRSYAQVSLLFFICFLSVASVATNFVTIKLPESVSVDLPKNWVLISNNRRITLDTWVESTFDVKQIPSIDSSFPFAANYYVAGATVGIINARYYPEIETSQKDVQLASSVDIRELDTVLKKNAIRYMKIIGAKITSWEGTEKRTINGITALVTEYHRKSLRNSGVFRVRLVRVFAADRSFTLTVSYQESQAFFLKNITDRIISSLTMTGYR